MINVEFKSVIELLKFYPNEQTCIDHLELMRWNGNVISPFEPTSKVYKCKDNRYRCKKTGKYFNVKTGTMFDNTKISLQTWFVAIYLITAHKKGISSMQLSRDLNITQKASWFLLQRIRNCFGIDKNGEDIKMGGGGQMVEVDETYVGGKPHNMTASKRRKIRNGEIDANDNKTTVMGYLERGGDLRLEVLTRKRGIREAVLNTLSQEAVLMTDSHKIYKGVGREFAGHHSVNHASQEFVRDGIFHTNGIEGAFSMFDRMVMGTYHYISQKHMQKYADELSFRYNTRTNSECSRFNLMLQSCSRRLTYHTLIGK